MLGRDVVLGDEGGFISVVLGKQVWRNCLHEAIRLKLVQREATPE